MAISLGSDAFDSGGEAAAIEAEGDVQRQSVDAPSLGTTAGVINLEVVNELVEVDLPSGERQAAYVMWAYAPESQLVHWSLRYPTPYDPPDRLAEIGSRIRYFASTQEIVRVEPSAIAPSVFISRSTKRAASREQAGDLAARGARDEIVRLEVAGRTTLTVEVFPDQFLPMRFYNNENAVHWTQPKILGLRREGSGWILTLEGEPGYVAELVLDANFLQTSARLIAEPPRVRYGQAPEDSRTWIQATVKDDPYGRESIQLHLWASVVVFELPSGEEYQAMMYSSLTNDRSDPSKEIEWWRLELGGHRTDWAADFRNNSRFYHLGDQLVEIRAADRERLEITSSKKVPAPRMHNEALKYLVGHAQTLREQPLKLGVDVFPSQVVASWSEKAGSRTEVADLERSGDGWVLTITGETGAMARIALDEEFRAVGGELVHDPDVAE